MSRVPTFWSSDVAALKQGDLASKITGHRIYKSARKVIKVPFALHLQTATRTTSSNLCVRMQRDDCKERLLGDVDGDRDGHALADSNVYGGYRDTQALIRRPAYSFMRNLSFIFLTISLVGNVLLLYSGNISHPDHDLGRSNFSEDPEQ